ERLFGANGLSYVELRRDHDVVGMPLLETGAKYQTPCRLGDGLELTSWGDEWARRTFVVKHPLGHAAGPGAGEGYEPRAWVVADPASPKGLRAVAVPEAVIARFTD